MAGLLMVTWGEGGGGVAHTSAAEASYSRHVGSVGIQNHVRCSVCCCETYLTALISRGLC